MEESSEDRKQMLRSELERRKMVQEELARRRGTDMSESQETPKYQDASFLSKLPANIAAGLGQLGHNILGESHREWEAVAPEIAKHIPKQQDYNYPQMLGLPQTTTDKLMQGMARNALLMASPAGELGIAGKAIGAIPKAGEFLAGAASRIAPQATLGAVSEENPEEGAKHSALVQSIMEGVPLLGKPAAMFAEAVNPVKYAKNTLNNIREGLKTSEQAEKEAYRPFNELAKKHEIEFPENYHETHAENSEHFGSRVKRLDRKFNEDPTLENAHKLQSRMFKDIKNEHKKADPDFDKIEALQESRDALKKDTMQRLEEVDKNAASEYKRGAKIHASEVQPHYANPALAHLIEGDIKKIEPSRLKNALESANEKRMIPEGHYLQKALQDMTSKLNKGAAIQYGLPAIAGGIAGPLTGHGGIAPIILSTLLGGAAGHGAGKLSELIQNPEVEKFLTKLGKVGKYAQPLARGAFD